MARLRRERMPECSIAECLVLRHDAGEPDRSIDSRGRQCTVFFTPTARSIVLG
jgi:hypothetical protein